MTVEAFPERVLDAVDELRDEERRLVSFDAGGQVIAGQWVADLSQTRMMVGQLGPAEWEHVAAFLHALLDRAPVKASPAYEAERILLGALAWELRAYAASAGEPVGLQADLRAASSKVEEQRIQARIEASRQSFHDHISRAIDDGHAQRALEAARPATEPVATPQAPVSSEEVIPSWL